MQIFGVHTDGREAAQKLELVHVGSQLRESVQILSTVLHWYGKPLTGVVATPRGNRQPYKPFNANHPGVRWAGASQQHFKWLLRHADRLASRWWEYKRCEEHHLCHYFLVHIHDSLRERAPDSYPQQMPATITADAWLATLDPHLAEQWAPRVATLNPPDGCAFGLLLMEPEHRVPNDWVASYTQYYAYKLTKPTVTRIKRPREEAEAVDAPVAVECA